MEKKLDPSLWKPIAFKKADVKDYSIPGKKKSFLDYQAPKDRYEVRGIMPKASGYSNNGFNPNPFR